MREYISRAIIVLCLLTISTIDAKSKKKCNTIIAWDLHDVLIKRSGAIQTFWNYQNMRYVLADCNFTLLRGLSALVWKNLFQESSSQYYINLARQHGNYYLADLIIKVTNAQELIPGMLEIVKELNSLGYTQTILSNIGQDAFKALSDPVQYPQFKQLFSYMDLKRAHVVGDDGIKKPHPVFYEAFCEINKIHKKCTQIIFIDDKMVNLVTAQEFGFTPIYYRNPYQLRQSLQKLSIAVPLTLPPTYTNPHPIPRPTIMRYSVPHKVEVKHLAKTIAFY